MTSTYRLTRVQLAVLIACIGITEGLGGCRWFEAGVSRNSQSRVLGSCHLGLKRGSGGVLWHLRCSFELLGRIVGL